MWSFGLRRVVKSLAHALLCQRLLPALRRIDRLRHQKYSSNTNARTDTLTQRQPQHHARSTHCLPRRSSHSALFPANEQLASAPLRGNTAPGLRVSVRSNGANPTAAASGAAGGTTLQPLPRTAFRMDSMAVADDTSLETSPAACNRYVDAVHWRPTMLLLATQQSALLTPSIPNSAQPDMPCRQAYDVCSQTKRRHEAVASSLLGCGEKYHNNSKQCVTCSEWRPKRFGRTPPPRK